MRTRWRAATGAVLTSRRLRNSQQRKMYLVGSAIGCRSTSLLLIDVFDMLLKFQHTPGQSNGGKNLPKIEQFGWYSTKVEVNFDASRVKTTHPPKEGFSTADEHGCTRIQKPMFFSSVFIRG